MRHRDTLIEQSLMEHSANLFTLLQNSITLQVILQGVQLQTVNLIDSSARSKSPYRQFSYKYVAVEMQNITSHTEESSAINKSCTLQRVQLQTIHSVEALLQTSLHAESLTTQIHHVQTSALLTSYSVELSQETSPCREFSYNHITLHRFWLQKIIMQRVQLQTNHPVEISATNKMPCREISQKSPCRKFSYKNHPVESSAANKSPCREFSYKQVTLQRDQLQRNHPVDSTATNKLPLLRGQLERNHIVESSATNKSHCREFSYEKITVQIVQL